MESLDSWEQAGLQACSEVSGARRQQKCGGLLRQAAAGALAAAMVSQAFRASAVYMSAGPPPM